MVGVFSGLVLDGDVALCSLQAERKSHDGHDTPTIVFVSSAFHHIELNKTALCIPLPFF